MSPAPVDIAYSLPPDWIPQTLAYRPEVPLRSFVARLQGVVTAHGERAIVLEHIQELALIACGLKTPGDSMISGLFTLLRRLADDVGNWAIDAPLAEHDWTRKAVHQVGNDLDSLWAEWMVLERLVEHGWAPIESARIPCCPDWTVQRERRFSVEVKHKHALGSCRHRLTWVLRGLSFLPAYQFLKNYSWDWSAPDNLRDRDVEIILDHVFNILPDLGIFLSDSQQYLELRHGSLSCVIAGPGEPIIEYRSIKGPIVQLHGQVSDPGRELFNPGSIETAWPKEPADGVEREETLSTFRRINIQEDRDFVCIVWPVPWHWRLTEEWIVQTVHDMDSVWGQQAGALWPLGWSPNDPAHRWFPNTRAEELLRS